MKLFKKNFKVLIGILIGAVLASSITVYAYSYFASDVQYTDNQTVAQALDDLYSKIHNSQGVSVGSNDLEYRGLKMTLDETTHNTIYTYNEKKILPIYWYGYEAYSRRNARYME